MAQKKRPPHRPTKYKPEYVKKADAYLKSCVKSLEAYHKHLSARGINYLSDKKKIEVELKKIKLKIPKPKLPTVEGLAYKLNVVVSTLYEWDKKHPAFSKALTKITEKRKELLMEGGLFWDYNPTVAKLILSSNHGMTERSDLTSAGEGLKISFDDSFTPKTKGD